jgi:hypothetical protein
LASPADANGAAGPQHFVEFINGRFSVYDKTTGSRLQTMTDLDFWSAAGLSIPSTRDVSDPRIIFDPSAQRWFASMIDINVSSRRQNSNHFLLAVSQTADPTGAWTAVSFPVDANGQLFADFPTLGLDNDNVYLSGDMFDRYSNPVGPSFVSISKSALLASSPDASARLTTGALNYGARGDIVQPAITTGQPTTPEVFIAAGDVGIDFQTHSTLILSTAANSPSLLATPAVTLTVPDYSVPIDPIQPDGSNNLDNGDARLSACARRVGNVLYVAQNVEVNNRAAVRWYRIDASQATLIESGTITDPTLDLFYPSIAANEAGTVVIGCNGSSSSTYVSSYALVGQVTNGSLTFGPLTLLKSGTASYQNTDATGTSRWGDYSATTLDPADPNSFWTIQMIAVGSSKWATQISQIVTGPLRPRLTVTPTTEGLVVSWPATATNYQLQSSPALGAHANWTPVTQSPSLQNNINSVSLSTSQSQAFLRLVTADPSQN